MLEISDMAKAIADVLRVVPGVSSAEPLPPDSFEGLELPHFYVLYEGLTLESRSGGRKLNHAFRLRLIIAQAQSARWAMENAMTMVLPAIDTLQKGDNLTLSGLVTNTEIAEVVPIPAEWMARTGYLGFDFIYNVLVNEGFDYD